MWNEIEVNPRQKAILKNFVSMCQSLFFNKVAGCNFIKKGTLAQVISRQLREFFRIASHEYHERLLL